MFCAICVCEWRPSQWLQGVVAKTQRVLRCLRLRLATLSVFAVGRGAFEHSMFCATCVCVAKFLPRKDSRRSCCNAHATFFLSCVTSMPTMTVLGVYSFIPAGPPLRFSQLFFYGRHAKQEVLCVFPSTRDGASVLAPRATKALHRDPITAYPPRNFFYDQGIYPGLCGQGSV